MNKIFSICNAVFLTLATIVPSSALMANVTSTSGNISFDIDDNQRSEMTLSSNGLAIGDNLFASANLHVEGNAIVSDTLAVGSAAQGSANLKVSGLFSQSYETVSANVTIGDHSVVLAGNTSGNITVFLPHAESVGEGRLYTIKKTVSANDVTIRGGGNVDGKSGVLLSSGNLGVVKVMNASDNWHVLELDDGASNHLPKVEISETQVVGENFATAPDTPYSKSFDVINREAVLLVGVYLDNSPATLTNIDFGGQSPDGLIKEGRGHFFYFLNPTTASGQSISFEKSHKDGGVCIWELANVDMSGSVTPSLTDSIVTDKANEFIVSFAWRNKDLDRAPTGDVSTDIINPDVNGGGFLGGGNVAADTAGSYDVSWNNVSVAQESGKAAFAFEVK